MNGDYFNKKYQDSDIPKTILDVIQEEYPDRYRFMVTSCQNKNELFTAEEWLHILIKSRKSYLDFLRNNKQVISGTGKECNSGIVTKGRSG